MARPSAPLSLAALLPLLALGACAHDAGGETRGEGVWVVGPGGAQGRVEARQVRGPTMNLARAPDEVRGAVLGGPVLLRLGEGEVKGMVAERPVGLTVQEVDGALQVRGLFAGQLTQLTATAEAVEGRAGGCSYTLHAVDGGYEGVRACGGLQEPAALTFPGDVWRSRTEEGAFLALLLTPWPGRD